jgi:hypothetical protein
MSAYCPRIDDSRSARRLNAAMICLMEIGDEWIYRAKTNSPSERVKICGIEKRKQTTRVDIEFLDGECAGLHDNVPALRLHGPWSTVTEYDERMTNWQRLGGSDLDETEETDPGRYCHVLRFVRPQRCDRAGS